jgi:hypothetical protein
MRRLMALVFFVLTATGSIWARNIVIGQIQYLGTNTQGVSAFKVTLNTNSVAESPITFANVTLTESGRQQSTGRIVTPVEVLFVGGGSFPMPGCPCKELSLQLAVDTAAPTITLRLRNGEWITVSRVSSSFLRPLRGQLFLLPGQSAPITLTSIPQPWERRPPRRLQQPVEFNDSLSLPR